MNYIENIYICLAAPLLLAILCLRKGWRRALLFFFAGMTACLFSAYITSFAGSIMGAVPADSSYEIAPAVEEIMKFLPLMFYILVFEAEKKQVVSGAVMVAVGFATFENICFFTTQDNSRLLQLLIRGFGTGAMHVVCGVVVAVGLFFLWDQVWLRMVGAFALLCTVATFHAIFNILVIQPGAIAIVGSMIPTVMLLAFRIFLYKKIDFS